MVRQATMSAEEIIHEAGEVMKYADRYPDALDHHGVAVALKDASPHLDTTNHWFALAYLILDQAGCTPEQSKAAIEVAMGEKRAR